jgi:hypothetical protein
VVKCRHCGKSFIPKPGKPGYIDECPECVSERYEAKLKGGPKKPDAESGGEFQVGKNVYPKGIDPITPEVQKLKLKVGDVIALQYDEGDGTLSEDVFFGGVTQISDTVLYATFLEDGQPDEYGKLGWSNEVERWQDLLNYRGNCVIKIASEIRAAVWIWMAQRRGMDIPVREKPAASSPAKELVKDAKKVEPSKLEPNAARKQAAKPAVKRIKKPAPPGAAPKPAKQPKQPKIKNRKEVAPSKRKPKAAKKAAKPAPGLAVCPCRKFRSA